MSNYYSTALDNVLLKLGGSSMSSAAAAVMMRSVVLTTIVTLILCVWWFQQQRRRYRSSKSTYSDISSLHNKNLPPLAPLQGSSSGILASISLFVSNKLPFTLLEYARTVGSVYRLPFPGRNIIVVIVGDPILAKRMLNDTTSTKTRAYRWMENIAGGDTFFSTEGTRCTHVKKSASVSLGNSVKLDEMTNLCRMHAKEWIVTTLSTTDNEPWDVLLEMQRLTTRFLVDAAFDYKMSDDEVEMVLSSFQIACQEYGSKRALDFTKFLPIFGRLLHPGVRRAKEATRQLLSFASTVLQHYRQRQREQQDETTTREGTLVERIVLDQEYATDDERIRDIIAFLFGGYETTAITLSFCLLELARHPTEQERLHQDLMTCSHDLQSSSVLQRVIRETLRLHPAPAVASVRKVAKDFHHEGMVLPAGSSVCISSFLIHRNDDIFQHADSFMPSRWINPSSQELEAFMPFGSGRRSCLGRALANAELTVILSELCSKYKFVVVDEGQYDYVITHKTVGLKLHAQPWT